MGKVLQRIERRRYIWLRIIPNITNVILIGSLLLALSFAFNYNGFRDSFQSWYEIAILFYWIIFGPFFPHSCYDGYQEIKSIFKETHEFNQEASMSENEVYLYHTPKALSYPKKLFRLLKGDF